MEYTRLNSHYRPAVELARLIIENSSLELFHGEVTGASFVLDMNKVFQDFVTVALREKLGVSENTFRSDKKIPRVTLDQAGSIKLEPDLSWWESGKCTFVGDAKYKNITDKAVPESDIYQMLAYTTALNLPGGLLVYAKGEAENRVYRVRHSGKAIEGRFPGPEWLHRGDSGAYVQPRVQGKGAALANHVRALSLNLSGLLVQVIAFLGVSILMPI